MCLRKEISLEKQGLVGGSHDGGLTAPALTLDFVGYNLLLGNIRAIK